MFKDVIGDWPTYHRFILCSCDEIYLNKYFPRFYKTFTEHWSLPIHVHVVDPSAQSLERLSALEISHTHCETQGHHWLASAEKLRASNPNYQHDTIEHMRQAMYECYCQAQRFIVMGHNLQAQQHVIVADVDAYALRRPTEREHDRLFDDMAFTTFNRRLMATFCHFHPKRKEQCLTAASLMTTMVMDSRTLGVDQKVLKQVFGSLPYTELTNGEWIRHFNVKTQNDMKEHNQCLIYHEKGTRGKLKTVETTWTDIEKQR